MTSYAVVNPATGELVAEYPTATDEQVREAVDRAAEVAATWSDRAALPERVAALRRVGQLHTERREQLAHILVREMGKPFAAALDEIGFCEEIYAYYADNAEQLLADEPINLPEGDDPAFVRRSALGVLLGVMPWNYPYYQTARFAAPNLLIGNTLLLKQAPQCPESARAIEDMFRDAGFADGTYVNVFATNDQVAEVIADPRVHGVSLTGSERAGAAVAEVAGRHLKKVVLELGGSDPFIVLDTGDMDAVVDHAVHVRLENAGQACNGGKRFVVVDELYDLFLDKFTAAMTAVRPGDPTKPETVLGPVSSSAAADRLENQLERALDQGATLHAGGKRDGNYFEPTILTGVAADNDAYREEFFGPIAQVFRVADEEEAVRVANDTPYGLGSYLITDDPARALRVAEQLVTGMVFVNLVHAGGVQLPFGGVKNSGFGRELGTYGVDEFVNKKLIRVPA